MRSVSNGLLINTILSDKQGGIAWELLEESFRGVLN